MGVDSIIIGVAMVRLVPYIIAAYISWTKGWNYLLWVCILASGMVVLSAFHLISEDVRVIIASITAFLIMLHAYKLPLIKR